VRHHVANPRVSVVIPTHNRAEDLRRCLASLAKQSVQDFEVIVCDDGSTDDSAAAVAAFETVLDVRYEWEANWGGAARPRNRGVAMARAEYVAFLDSDDWWCPEKLERSIAALEHGGDVVYHDLTLADGIKRLRAKRVRSWALQRPVFGDLLERGNALPLSSVVMRRSMFRDSGGMPEDRALIAMEDYECWLNVAKLTDRFVRIPESLGFYWAGGGNISSDARTLKLLDVLEERHRSDPGWRGAPSWIAYNRARIAFRRRDFTAARLYFALIDSSRAPNMIRAKSAWTRLEMLVLRASA
jgi:glycosyltransferase involved in cell wall biosynthesis